MRILHRKLVLGIVLISSIIYVLQSLLAVPNKDALEKYHLSAGQAKILAMTIVIPALVIWATALIGYIRLDSYARSLSKGKDADAIHDITQGIAFITVYLPLSSLLSILVTYLSSKNSDLTPMMVIINNYANLLLLVPVYLLLHSGSVKLVSAARTALRSPNQKLLFVYLAFTALYVMLVFSDSARHVAVSSTTPATYYLPDWLIMLTIIIPRLFMWLLGIQAIQNLYYYRQKVRGSIYRVAVGELLLGLAITTGSLIMLRCLQSTSTALSNLSLSLVLLVIYGILILIAAGYVFIARGAKRLQSIENI
jgi:hypothetical protein